MEKDNRYFNTPVYDCCKKQNIPCKSHILPKPLKLNF